MNLEIIKLFKKHYDNQCSLTELNKVMELFATGIYQNEWDYMLKAESEKIILENPQTEMSDYEVSMLHNKIIQTIEKDQEKILKLPSRKSTIKQIAIAASIFLVSGLGFLLYKNKLSMKIGEAIVDAYDIAPGKNGATLTLANGEKVLIKDALAGKIAMQAGVQISKTANGQIVYEIKNENVSEIAYNTLSTTRGEQTEVRLPDGTLVFLNAESSLKYPTSFVKSDKRKVSLTGEGYFEVAKDRVHPFIVQTQKQEIKVLGTHFNVNNYADEPVIATTLIEGSVQVTSGNKTEILKPGEQAINDGNRIKISTIDVDNAIDWKSGNFYLDRLNFRSVMRKIERWYDVEVIYDASVTDDIASVGWISRKKKLSDILKFIEASGQVRFRIDGKKVYVSK